MKSLMPLLLAAMLLAVLLTLMLAPGSAVLLNKPLAAVGVGLIGLGLIRRAQQAAPSPLDNTELDLAG